jgi:hypothetical protein
MAGRTTARGAHALGGDARRRSGGWWKWLLALLLLAAVAILLIALLTGGDDSPKSTTESAVTNTAGDGVDLRGPVKKAPKSAGTTLKLNEADAALVSTQGAYINADIVKAAS